MRILLHTKDGAHVAELHIPHFTPPPDVMFWGERCFILKEVHANNLPMYFEAFVYAAPDPNTYGDPISASPEEIKAANEAFDQARGMTPTSDQWTPEERAARAGSISEVVAPDGTPGLAFTAPAAPGEVIDAEVPKDAPDSHGNVSLDYAAQTPDSTDVYRDHELAADAQRDQELAGRTLAEAEEKAADPIQFDHPGETS